MPVVAVVLSLLALVFLLPFLPIWIVFPPFLCGVPLSALSALVSAIGLVRTRRTNQDRTLWWVSAAISAVSVAISVWWLWIAPRGPGEMPGAFWY